MTTTAVIEVDGCTCQLLVLAAQYLPHLSRPVPLRSPDLHDALHEAALFVGASDRWHAHRLADAAESRFVAYLLASGQTTVDPCERCTLRGWLISTDTAVVVRELHRAAHYYRLIQAATTLDIAGLQDFLLGR